MNGMLNLATAVSVFASTSRGARLQSIRIGPATRRPSRWGFERTPQSAAASGGGIEHADGSAMRLANRIVYPGWYPATKACANSPQPSTATKSSNLNGKLTWVGFIICIPSASSTLEITRSMTKNGR